MMDKEMQHKVIPFHPGHLTVIETMPDEMITQMTNWEDEVNQLAEIGFAFSLVVDGRVVLCGGIVETLPGSAQAWLLPSAYINTYKLPSARAVKRVFDDLMETHALHRISTGCQKTALYAEWMAYLGFEPEGEERQAGVNRTDLVRWARVKD